MRLEGKTCIITGAASGIGKAATLLFLEEGANVAACDISEDALVALKKEVEEKNFAGTLATYKLDVTDREAVIKVVEGIVDTFMTIDVLVNNAGITRDQLLVRMSEKDWDAVVNVNLKGVFNI